MKLFRSNSICRQRRDHASVLIVVLWIAIGMVSIALYFANSMTYELRASDNRVSGMAAEQAIEGAARYAGYVLYNYSTNGAVPQNNQFACIAVPVGDAHYWMIGRDPTETQQATDPYFGLVDEASKLNLNTVSSNVLLCLPNMDSDFVGAILDWRSTNGVGVYSLDYNGLGYDDKNAPFETVDELRLVYGASLSLLMGDDLNLNGVLDSNETNTQSGGQSPSGLFEYFTVYSREPNFTTFNGDTVLLTNVNTISEENMQTLFQDDGVGSADSLASSVYNTIHVPTSGRGGGTTTANTCNGILDFCVRCKKAGMSSDDFAKLDNATTSASTYIHGRVNIDSASTAVLTALFWGVGLNRGVDESTAETAAQDVLNYRQQNAGNLNSVAWLVDALGTSSPVIAALQTGDYVTSRSYQFSADIAALGPYGRGYRRVKFVFDTSNGMPQIIYRQDLSGLGWALGEKVRQTSLVNATQ
jgi:hypothetical protein